MYRLGDVVLLEYPYTDLVGVKLRPAIVILDTNDSDVIVVRVTSQHWESEYDIEIADWEFAGLLKPSIIRVHKIATLETRLVRRQLGRLNQKDLNNLSFCLKRTFGV